MVTRVNRKSRITARTRTTTTSWTVPVTGESRSHLSSHVSVPSFTSHRNVGLPPLASQLQIFPTKTSQTSRDYPHLGCRVSPSQFPSLLPRAFSSVGKLSIVQGQRRGDRKVQRSLSVSAARIPLKACRRTMPASMSFQR